MALRTAGSVLVFCLWSVAATTATKCGQKSQVMVSPTNTVWGQCVTLTCNTTCTLSDNPNPTYIWYKNGQRLDEPTFQQYSVISYFTNSYSCAVKDHEDLLSPAVCVLGKTCFNVTYLHQSICALKGSTVELPCTYQHPSNHTVSESNWYIQEKLDEEPKILSSVPEYAGREEFGGDKENVCTLRITDLRESDSAEYWFTFKTQTQRYWYNFLQRETHVRLSVTGLQVQVSSATVTEGKAVLLTCRTTCTLTDNPTYIWYKNGQLINNQNNYLFLDPVSGEDAGRYSCTAKGYENLHSPEETLTVISVFPWVPVVGAVLTAGALLVTVYCTLKRRSTGGSDATADTQSVHPDQNMRTTSPDYVNLARVHPDHKSDTYTALNMRTMSPDYDTLASVRDSPSDTATKRDAQPSHYDNW